MHTFGKLCTRMSEIQMNWDCFTLQLPANGESQLEFLQKCDHNNEKCKHQSKKNSETSHGVVQAYKSKAGQCENGFNMARGWPMLSPLSARCLFMAT